MTLLAALGDWSPKQIWGLLPSGIPSKFLGWMWSAPFSETWLAWIGVCFFLVLVGSGGRAAARRRARRAFERAVRGKS